jgi:hypothetical protein
MSSNTTLNNEFYCVVSKDYNNTTCYDEAEEQKPTDFVRHDTTPLPCGFILASGTP